MVKSYLRYVLDDAFGSVCTPSCRSLALLSDSLVATGTDENVSIWNCRSGELKFRLGPKNNDDEYDPCGVTCMHFSNAREPWIYVGYADGAIRGFKILGYRDRTFRHDEAEEFYRHGHKSSVTCMATSDSGQLLATGARDCNIVIWDVFGDSGLFRLEGHKNEVTAISFLRPVAGSNDALTKLRRMTTNECTLGSNGDLLGYLVSVSKDCLVLIWDLTTQSCIQTIFSSTGELYGLAINPKQDRMYVGGKENFIRCFKLDMHGGSFGEANQAPVYAKELGSLNRIESHGRCSALKILGSETEEDPGLLLCAAGQFVETYRLYAADEIKHRTKRRLKRIATKKRAKISKLREALEVTGRQAPDSFPSLDAELEYLERLLRGVSTKTGETHEIQDQLEDLAVSDECMFMFSVLVNAKIVAFDCGKNCMLLGHGNNSISLWKVPMAKLTSPNEESDTKGHESLLESVVCLSRLDTIGHPDPIKCLYASHDDTMILSISDTNLKLWNTASHRCIKTLDIESVSCGFFVAGNRHLVVGTRGGLLKLVNLDSGDIDNLYTNKGVEAVSISEHPAHIGFAVAYRDGEVLMFDFSKKSGKIAVNLQRRMQLADEPVDIQFSPNANILAVALLDSTIQTLHADSFKLFLTLYGHKLPITSIAISDDGTLLASSSLDKTVKVWGLDFGNIHKSILAHSGITTKLSWLYDTHYLVTCGSDFMLKIFDCDTYEEITQLHGHITSVKSLALGGDGSFIASAGNDCTIRFWKRTGGQLFISEEQQRREQLKFAHEATRDDLAYAIPVDADAIKAKASVKSIQSIKATEQLVQVIDEAFQYREALNAYYADLQEFESSNSKDYKDTLEQPTAPPVPLELFNRTPLEHVMYAIGTLNHSIVHEVLIALPFLYATRLLEFIAEALEIHLEANENGNDSLLPTEMACKVALLILQIYATQFMAMQTYRPLMSRLKALLHPTLELERSRLYYNKAALEFLYRTIQTGDVVKRTRD